MNDMTDSSTNAFDKTDMEQHGATSAGVVMKLREMIHQGELRHGDRLPPARDLATIFGVSRPTLPAAISSLAAVGALQSRQGAGTGVVNADASRLLDSSS